MPASFEVPVTTRGEFVVVTPSGRLGIMESEALGAALEPLLSQPSPRVALDLRDVGFIGSRAIGVLMQAHGEIAKQKGILLVGNLQPEAARIFEVTRISTLLHIVGDLNEVLKRHEERTP